MKSMCNVVRLVSVLLAAGFCALLAAVEAKKELPKPTAHTVRPIEGWNVQVDQRLLDGEASDLGRRALRLLVPRSRLVGHFSLEMSEPKGDDVLSCLMVSYCWWIGQEAG